MMTTAKKRILFVDDEPDILGGLRGLFRKDRARWDMEFASSGAQALDALRRGSFDVVVTDMRMPGMDGATLLTRIKAESPSTARIMLTGHSEQEAIVRGLPAIHRLLSKPCTGAVLRAAIEECVNLEPAIDPVLWAEIGKLDKLPSPSAVHLELAALLARPDATVASVAAVIMRDPSACAKVLQLVNSGYFGMDQLTTSIERAIGILGLETIQYIALTASVFAPSASEPCTGFSLADLDAASVGVATIAARLVPDARELVFAGALMHDLGASVLARGAPERYREVLERVNQGEPMDVVERELFGGDHAEVGASLLKLWGVPASLVEIVRWHHDPGSASPELRELVAAVHVADALTNPWRGAAGIDRASVERAGCADRLAGWLATAAQVCEIA